jgi:hypothetical protein
VGENAQAAGMASEIQLEEKAKVWKSP